MPDVHVMELRRDGVVGHSREISVRERPCTRVGFRWGSRAGRICAQADRRLKLFIYIEALNNIRAVFPILSALRDLTDKTS